MPVASELIAYGREVNEICQLIRADGLIFQDLRIWKQQFVNAIRNQTI